MTVMFTDLAVSKAHYASRNPLDYSAISILMVPYAMLLLFRIPKFEGRGLKSLYKHIYLWVLVSQLWTIYSGTYKY